MQAAYYNRQGKAADVLVVGEVPRPEPGPGEVRVRVHVSGLNPTDIKARTGFSGPMPFPRIIPHQDGAGVIDAVGTGVPPSRVGERVWVYLALQGRPGGTAGVISSYAVRGVADALSLPLLEAMQGGCVLRFVYLYTVPAEARREAVAAVNACLAAGAYRPAIGLRVPLDRIVEAHEAREEGTVIGKILVDLAPAAAS